MIVSQQKEGGQNVPEIRTITEKANINDNKYWLSAEQLKLLYTVGECKIVKVVIGNSLILLENLKFNTSVLSLYYLGVYRRIKPGFKGIFIHSSSAW